MVKALEPVARAFGAWERFLFEPVSALPLAFFRVVFGAYLFYYYVDLFPFLRLYYFPPGLLPPPELAELGPNVLSLIRYGTLPRSAAYGLMLAASLALAFGLQTRLAALICWLLNQGFMALIPAGRNSGDNAVGVACFLFLVAALAGHVQRVYSLDARFGGTAFSERAQIPAWTSRLFQLQLVYVYFFSGFHKLASHDWYVGEALFYVFQQRGWSRVDLSWFTHPLLVGLVTYGTLLFELVIFPVLVWVRALRPFVLIAGVAFHLGIAATMRVFVFGEIMPILYLAFVDPTPLVVAIEARYRAFRAAPARE
jgi:hypothetical protein